MGGHRAGVIPNTEACSELISSVLALEETGTASLLGLYSHAGQSYASDSQYAPHLFFLSKTLCMYANL